MRSKFTQTLPETKFTSSGWYTASFQGRKKRYWNWSIKLFHIYVIFPHSATQKWQRCTSMFACMKMTPGRSTLYLSPFQSFDGLSCRLCLFLESKQQLQKQRDGVLSLAETDSSSSGAVEHLESIHPPAHIPNPFDRRRRRHLPAVVVVDDEEPPP